MLYDEGSTLPLTIPVGEIIALGCSWDLGRWEPPICKPLLGLCSLSVHELGDAQFHAPVPLGMGPSIADALSDLARNCVHNNSYSLSSEGKDAKKKIYANHDLVFLACLC